MIFFPFALTHNCLQIRSADYIVKANSINSHMFFN